MKMLRTFSDALIVLVILLVIAIILLCSGCMPKEQATEYSSQPTSSYKPVTFTDTGYVVTIKTVSGGNYSFHILADPITDLLYISGYYGGPVTPYYKSATEVYTFREFLLERG